MRTVPLKKCWIRNVDPLCRVMTVVIHKREQLVARVFSNHPCIKSIQRTRAPTHFYLRHFKAPDKFVPSTIYMPPPSSSSIFSSPQNSKNLFHKSPPKLCLNSINTKHACDMQDAMSYMTNHHLGRQIPKLELAVTRVWRDGLNCLICCWQSTGSHHLSKPIWESTDNPLWTGFLEEQSLR